MRFAGLIDGRTDGVKSITLSPRFEQKRAFWLCITGTIRTRRQMVLIDFVNKEILSTRQGRRFLGGRPVKVSKNLQKIFPNDMKLILKLRHVEAGSSFLIIFFDHLFLIIFFWWNTFSKSSCVQIWPQYEHPISMIQQKLSKRWSKKDEPTKILPKKVIQKRWPKKDNQKGWSKKRWSRKMTQRLLHVSYIDLS